MIFTNLYYILSKIIIIFYDKVLIETVTRKADSRAPKDELTFKCSINCPANATFCQNVANATSVNWYSESNLIFTNSLMNNNVTKQLYSFLNETMWTNYINTNVSIFAIKLA